MDVEFQRELGRRFTVLGGGYFVAAQEFPDSRDWRHIRDQMMRAGTSLGAHYAEARGARSKADLINKLSLVLQELREAVHWLGVADVAGVRPANHEFLSTESGRLAALLSKSVATLRR